MNTIQSSPAILENDTWSILFKTIKVMTDRLRNCHRPEEVKKTQ